MEILDREPKYLLSAHNRTQCSQQRHPGLLPYSLALSFPVIQEIASEATDSFSLEL